MAAKKPAIQAGQGHPTGIIGDTGEKIIKSFKNAKIKSARKTVAKSYILNPSGSISRKTKLTRKQINADKYLSEKYSIKGQPGSYRTAKDPYVVDRVLKTRPSKQTIKEHNKSMRSLAKGKIDLEKTLQKIDKKSQKDLKKINKKHNAK